MREDKSRQGHIDDDIAGLITLMNSKGFETTSSCSGRIVLLAIPAFGDKKNSKWLFKTHGKASPEDLLMVIEKEGGRLYFLQEPPIIHANCKGLAEAGRLLEAAKSCGFKHSGITSLKRFSVEIRGSERLETPLEGASEGFVRMLVDEANKKLEKGKENLRKLVRLLASFCEPELK